MSQRLKLNLGCGPVQPDGWLNIDGSIRAWLVARLPRLDGFLTRLGLLPASDFRPNIRYMNIARPLPWPDTSVDVIYMGEVLEHFTREQGSALLGECFRVLRPGGVMRVRVPDNAHFWSQYVAEYEEAKSKPREQWTLSHTRWIEMFFREICVERPRPWRSMGHFHKWMYDDISLIKLLEHKGFTEVERMPYRNSRIDGVEAVETREDLIVEGVRGSQR